MKIVKLISKTAALFAFAITLGTCQSVPGIVTEPAVSFESVSLTGINFSGTDMAARIRIQNNNSFAIPFPEINWDFHVSGASFLSGIIGNNTRIAARGYTTVELPFTVSYEGLFRTVAGLLTADEAPYRLELAARFPMPLLDDIIISTSFDGSLPLLRAPALSFDGMRFNSLSLSRIEFVLTWQLDNRNVFPVNLDKLGFNFAVNNVSWSSGSVENISLAARQVTQIPVTVGIESFAMIQEIVTLAAAGRTVNFVSSGEISLSPQGFANVTTAAFSRPFHFSGSTTLRP